MNKIFIIIQREYLTRVKKKSFVIMTLLTPLLMIAIIGAPVWLSGINDSGVNGIEVETSSEPALIVGIVTALLIYFFILIYGAQVMRGVVEEKANRIVEIIISSVKPFELMLGKIIGIALVGLTQFLVWVSIALFLSALWDASTLLTSTINALSSLNVVELLSFFIIYFLGGYLLYASLFAAIGAASDNGTDTQQFVIPVVLPIIFAIIVAAHSAKNPDGQLAFWTSIIPFTSPIVMMARIPTGVPTWELVVSVLVLLLSFIGTTWVAAKIYRTGILMYGKKITYMEIWKWVIHG